jgi:hypothetical protein
MQRAFTRNQDMPYRTSCNRTSRFTETVCVQDPWTLRAQTCSEGSKQDLSKSVHAQRGQGDFMTLRRGAFTVLTIMATRDGRCARRCRTESSRSCCTSRKKCLKRWMPLPSQTPSEQAPTLCRRARYVPCFVHACTCFAAVMYGLLHTDVHDSTCGGISMHTVFGHVNSTSN